jgi:hypothetical protein
MSTGQIEAAPRAFGPEEITAEDRAYAGSTFQEVREALFANPYYAIWGAPDSPPLPRYRVTLRSVLAGLLPFGRRYRFLQAARRTVGSAADLRWGPDRRGFRRLLHPNGVCLTGAWEITEPSDYTGYFRQGRVGLVIARYSTCCTETRRGRRRSLALVGKVYPTAGPAGPERVRPAHFITQQDLGGGRTAYINDAELRNAPDTTAWRRGLFGLPVILLTGVVFQFADKQPSQRQLYEIAELGKSDAEATRAPEFMRLRVDPGQPRVEGDDLDFRDEVLGQIYDPGEKDPKRTLTFHIEVSDEGSTRGPGIYQRRTIRNWRRLGRLVFREAVASHNGDCVVHFHHPPWRADRNDPSSLARPSGSPSWKSP